MIGLPNVVPWILSGPFVVLLAAVVTNGIRPFPAHAQSATRTESVEFGDSIQDAVDRNPEGTTFVIKQGIHRTQSITPKNGDSFIGETGAILSGAKVINSFEREGQYWVAKYSVPQVNGPGKCLPQYPACTLPEDLFIDNLPLQRVTSQAELVSGRWYLDYAAGRVYLFDSPTGRTVELSETRYAFYGAANNVTIRGLVIEKYATPAGSGAIHALRDSGPLSHDWLVEDNEIRLNHGAGIRSGHGTHILRNRIHHNGQIGITGAGRNVLVEGNEISYNNFAGYSYAWEAGGTKFSFTERLVVRNNYVHHNQGPGLWTDIDNHNTLYEQNRTSANRASGIVHEISFDAIIRYNTIENDGFSEQGTSLWHGAGISIESSSNVEVYGNTVVNCMNGITAIQTNRGSSRRSGKPYLLQNLFVHDNTITQTQGSAAGIAKDSTYFDDSIFTRRGNRFQDNIYKLADPKGKYYSWTGASRSKEEWQALGNDVHGKWLDLVTSPPNLPRAHESRAK